MAASVPGGPAGTAPTPSPWADDASFDPMALYRDNPGLAPPQS
jgi:hypothetical protein